MPHVPSDLGLAHVVVYVISAMAVQYYGMVVVHEEQFLVLPCQVVLGLPENMNATLPLIEG